MKIFKLLLLFCLTYTSSYALENSLEKVSLQLQWKHQFEFAGFYAAKEKGFYKEVGLDVEFIEFDNGISIVDQVVKTDITYGLSYSSIIAEYLNGKPIVFLANYFKQSPLVLLTQKEITTLDQLKGTKIQGLSNSINNLSLYTMLEKFDVKANDIEIMPLTFSLEAFKNKEVDALAAFISNEPFSLDEMGVEYHIFDPVAYGITYYDTNLFTTKEELINNPLRVENFKKASKKGWLYALAHKEEIVDLILQKYNSQNKSRESLLFEAKQIEHIMLLKIHEIGSVDLNRVKLLAEDFIQSGFVQKGTPYLVEDFVVQNELESKDFTEEEKKYLEEKGFLSVCVDPNWMPFSAIINHKYTGIDSDFMNIFEERLGIPINIKDTSNWKQSIGYAKSKTCDILSMAAYTKERDEYLNFTDPYFSFYNVLVTKQDKSIIANIKDLKQEKIAIPSDYAEVEIFLHTYPNLEVVEVDSMQEGLDKVKNGEVYGFIDNAFVIDYYFTQEDYEVFKVGSFFEDKLDLRLGIRDDDSTLLSIMQKMILSISLDEQIFIKNKWLNGNDKIKDDSSRFYQLLLVLLLIIIVTVVVGISIKKTNIALKEKVQSELEKSKEKDKTIFHQSKLVAMGEMLENIAHQWRQPLSQVNSCVLVIDDRLDEKNIHDTLIEEKLQEVETLTQYMSNTIDDFKNFFDQNKVKEKVVLEEIIKKALDIVKTRVESSKIKVIVDLRLAHESFLYPSELQQVFLVILNNAIEMHIVNKIQKPSIKIEIKRIKEYNYINICDNAGGIHEDVIDKIFEPYYTTKHKAQGTGLGLYLSKLIVEDSLGGELKVKNTFSGVCFSIKLESSIGLGK